ncbi:MAG: fumarate hydratase C-terminal domain-containing protein [Candidatus Methanomethylophilaceae archaeon]|nr:fumarate hydratase C-terminal domain-containing protein [Candidatus Methanomethylophilaceae archaeon]
MLGYQEGFRKDLRRRCGVLAGGGLLKTLNTPLSEQDVRSLKLGETVYVFGPVITGRDEMHIRAIERSVAGEDVPSDIEGAVLFHCGPIMVQREDGTWAVVAAGPTTSARMNKLEPEMIRRFGIRAIIGKGGMSKDVAEAMREVGCVYLAATGGAAISLAEGLSRCTGVEWLDLGMAEAMWRFETERFGPLIVAMDAEGNSLYEQVASSIVRI